MSPPTRGCEHGEGIKHDCNYVDARNALITLASARTDKALAHLEPIGFEARRAWAFRWDAMFHSMMQELWTLRGPTLIEMAEMVRREFGADTPGWTVQHELERAMSGAALMMNAPSLVPSPVEKIGQMLGMSDGDGTEAGKV